MTQKKRVLLVGQNPDCFSGNGNMLGACLEDIDPEKYDVCAFLKDVPSITSMGDPFEYSSSINCKTIFAQEGSDPWGKNKLLNILYNIEIDIVVFIGIDIWRYVEIFDSIKKAQKRCGFIWKAIVPYDIDKIRDDWILWFKYPDQVYVYSEFGYNLIKNEVPSAKYYRPKLRYLNLYDPLSFEEKKDIKKQLFPNISDDCPVFGFVTNNQIRKNIYNTIKGFSEALEFRKDMLLYLHLDNIDHVYSIQRIAEEFNIPAENLSHNMNSRKLSPIEISVLYSVFDCHVLPSFQEGLSWTVVETKLLGVPSIISYNTAHIDFVDMARRNPKINPDNVLIQLKPDHEHQIPLITSYGPGYLLSKACSSSVIARGFLEFFERNMMNNEKVRNESILLGNAWINGCGNFQKDILEDVFYPDEEKSKSGEMI